MRIPDHNAEVEAILTEVSAHRLSEDEAFVRIRALSHRGPPRDAAPFGARFGFDDPLLRDHQLFGRRILMGVAHCSLALEAARAADPAARGWHLEKVSFEDAIQVKSGQAAEVEVILAGGGEARSFSSTYRTGGSAPRVAARGQLRPAIPPDLAPLPLEMILREATRVEDGSVFYSRQSSYGPSLQTLRKVFYGADGLLAEFELPPAAEAAAVEMAVPPAFFDGAYVASLAAAGWDALGGDLWVPLFIREAEVQTMLPRRWFCRTWLRKHNAEVIVTDHEFYGPTGQRLGFLRGLTVKRVRSAAALGINDAPAAVSAAAPAVPPPAPRAPAAPAGDGLRARIEAYLCARIGAIVSAPAEDISVENPFLELGADSASLIAVVNKMEKEMGIELYPTLFFEYQTIRELSGYLVADHAPALTRYFGTEAAAAPAAAEPAPAPAPAPAPPAAVGRKAGTGDIAVIGMSGRFARSRHLAEFWGHLRDGTDLITEVPPDHWDHRPWFDSRPGQTQKTYCRWGSFLDGIDKFDPLFFHMSPREADFMDPQLRLLLEVLYETTEDAGYASKIWGSKTGMYVGVCFKEYWDEIVRQRVPLTGIESFSSAMSFLANRPSYFFDLRGPSVPVDDACSSSLVALHLACRALQNGECEMAFASGINVLLSPLHYVYFSAIGALSPTGRCHSFASSADGYVPGEGIVSVLLKPLEHAVRDGDNIQAVIKGSALNHGGRANNPTSPRTQLQTEVLLSAWKDAGIAPDTLGYLEAHGTGTLLGDPVEVDALKNAFKAHTRRSAFCALGSAKAHIGHTEGAAGLAGVVKVILSMRNGMIPAMPGFDQPNPYIKLEGSPLYINAATQPWPASPDHPRRAGVSSFGMGGAYAHAVIEEYPQPVPPRPAAGPFLFVLSAHGEARLRAGAGRFAEFLGAEGAGCPAADLSFSLQVGRAALDHRLAVVFDGIPELASKLEALARGGVGGAGMVIGQRKAKASQPAAAALEAQWRQGDLAGLAHAWVQGAEVPWHALPRSGPARRISLPFSAFEERSHWMPKTGREGPSWGAGDEAHRWIDRVVPALHRAQFAKAFTGDELFLRDHRVAGEALLPGVAHLEIALAAAGMLGRGAVSCLRDVVWKRPLRVGPTGARCTLGCVEGAPVGWTLEGPDGTYTEGRVEFHSGDALPDRERLDLAAIRNRCGAPIEAAEVYGRFRQLGIEYGETMRPVASLWSADGVALASLEAAPAGVEYQSTRLLDGLLQAVIAFYPKPLTKDEVCLPCAADSVRVWREPAGSGFAYVESRVAPAPGRDAVFDLVLTEADGEVVAKIERLRIRSVRPELGAAEPAANPAPPIRARGGSVHPVEAFVARWRPAGPPPPPPPPPRGARTLVFRHARDLALAEKLAASAGNAATVVHLGRGYQRVGDRNTAIDCGKAEDFARVVEECPGVDVVYFLGGLPLRDPAGVDQGQFDEIRRVGVLSLLRLIRALPAHRRISLRVVTQDLYPVGTSAGEPYPFGALVAAAAQVAAKEYPNWQVSCVDITGTGELPADLIAAEFRAEIAIRGGRHYARELEAVSLPAPTAAELPLRRSGVYLIVGGKGGIGLAVARQLAQSHQARLVLVGRSEPTAEQARLIGEIEACGGQVLACRADAADAVAMGQVVAAARARFGPINGVIHSALTLRDRSIANMSDEDFCSVLSSKLEGSWLLDVVTRDEPLDFLVLFASVNSLLANAGQSNYVAGSAFQDSFAELLRRRGRPAQVISWGLWGEVGIMSAAGDQDRLSRLGIFPIQVAEGLDQWLRVLGSGLGQVACTKILPSAFAACGISIGGARVKLAGAVPSVTAAVGDALRGAAVPERAGADDAEQELADLEGFCAGKLAAVLAGMGALPATVGSPVTAVVPAGWNGRYRALWPALLDLLARAGLLDAEGGGWRLGARSGSAGIQPAEPAPGRLRALWDLAADCLGRLPEVVRGELPATDVLFPGGSVSRVEPVYTGNPHSDYFNALAAAAVHSFLGARLSGARPARPIRILEIGAGTGGTSRFILKAIAQALAGAGSPPAAVEFVYTDISQAFTTHGRSQFGPAYPFARFQVLNIEADIEGQGIEPNSADLIVAANVLHATRSISATLSHVKRLLARNGLLVLNELTEASNFATVTFGLLDGWWLAADPEERIPGSPLLSVPGWERALDRAGFRRFQAVGGRTARQSLILAESDGLVPDLEPAPVPAETTSASPAAAEPGRAGGSMEECVRREVAATLRLSPEEVDGDKRFSEYGVDSILAVELIKRLNRLLGTTLKTTLLFDYSSVNEMGRYLRTVVKEAPALVPRSFVAAGGSVRGLLLRGPGDLAGLRLEPIAVPVPQAGEIQIGIRACGINFGDWLCVQGLYPFMPEYPFVPGFEVAGEVLAIGPGITRFQVGDPVIALTGRTFGGHAERVTVDHRLAVAKPLEVSFEDAASYPVAFLTALEALEVARLRKGERILIQTAAGGTGLMAVQLALQRGAEVYGTAGSAEKVAHLKSIGVHEAINYRQQDFAAEVRRRTGGAGVDVVLNMLSGDAIQKGLDLLAPGGRYIEIALGGLKSAAGLDLSRLTAGQSIHSINLLHRLMSRLDEVPDELAVMARHLAEGRVKPIVGRVFEFGELPEAYRYLAERTNIGKAVVSLAPRLPDAQPATRLTDVAIIGMAGRFPEAKDLAEFWANLAAGRGSVREVPSERWALEGFYDPDSSAPDRSVSKWGGFLENIDQFDPLFFNISGHEAERMDPQQRLFLETAWHALENAGYSARELNGTRCGLFVGVSGGDYDATLKAAGIGADGYVFTGNQPSILAARLAYVLNLKGPALAVDTACSSSLVALHLACQALRQGEIEAALVGGVFINTTSRFHILCSKAGMLSASGQCRVFDQSADGFVPGEGVGAIVLKPLAKAIADGDRICAVIRGSGTNQDGRTNGITAPSAQSQAALEGEVYGRCGIDPSSISYVEAHGTGTKLGDPIEVEGLTQAFRAHTRDKAFCALGSVKSNIGHAATAAGIASILKVALSLGHRKIVPSLNFETENEHLNLRDTPFYVNRETRDWAAVAGRPRRAAVSSFGFSGTNCHVVMEEAPPAPRAAGATSTACWLFTLSAKTPGALRQRRRDLLAWIGRHPDCDLSAVSQTLNAGRDAFEFRSAFVAADASELARLLGEPPLPAPPHRAAGTVSGELLDEARRSGAPGPTRKALESLAEHFAGGADIDWSHLYRDAARRRVDLPGYPFERSRHWPGPSAPRTLPPSAPRAQGESVVALTGSEPFTREHVIGGAPLVPAVLFLDWAWQAAVGKATGRLEDCSWSAPLRAEKPGASVVVALDSGPAGTGVRISTGGSTHFRARARTGEPEAAEAADLEAIRARCTALVSAEAFYGLFSARGMNYSGGFRTVREVSYGGREALAMVALPGGTEASAGWPTAVLDGALQAAMVLVHRNADISLRPFVPAKLAGFTVHRTVPDQVIAHAVLVESRGSRLWFDVRLFTLEGVAVVEFEGLEVCEWHGAEFPDHPVRPASPPRATAADPAVAEAFVASILAGPLKIPAAAMRPSDSFEKFGIDSLMVNQLNAALEKAVGPVSRTLFFEVRNLRDLTAYLCRETKLGDILSANNRESGAPEGRARLPGSKSLAGGELTQGKISDPNAVSGGVSSVSAGEATAGNAGTIAGSDSTSGEMAIAIVGMAGRFPQAANMEAFWENLRSGRDCITEIPADRWDFSREYDPDPAREGKVYSKWGGFLEDFDRFDALFFKISPQEAELMDPQERLFLEASYAVLEDAGYTAAGLREACAERRGKDVGVFVGVMWGDHQLYAPESADSSSLFPRAGYWSIANRVSYSFDFQGPSMAIDTACSSSLTAIHLACESIRRGHCRAALAGGVNLSLHPNKYRQLCQARFGSTDGRCRSFGAGGDGYVPGEGVGAFLLKPLAAALADGDEVRAVIRATGCNHGGKTNGYTVPNPTAQAALIADVLERSRVEARTVGFVEAHGTGTALGDPIEITGLSRAFAETTSERQFCAIGSAKSNIGHLEAAAGVAAVAKVLLQFRHRQLAPSLHSAESNSNIRFEETPFYIQRELAEWNRAKVGGVEYLRRAAVSSFGAGGANAHLILEEPMAPVSVADRRPTPEVIVLSARDAERLREKALQLFEFLGSTRGWELAAVAFTLQEGREPMASRLAFVARDSADLLARLGSYLAGGSAHLHRGEVSELSPLGPVDAGNSADSRLPSEDATERAASAWVRGEGIDWRALRAPGSRPRRTSLPSYPFKGEHYWLPGQPAGSAVLPPAAERSGRAGANVHYTTEWLESPVQLEAHLGHRNEKGPAVPDACVLLLDDSPELAAEWTRLPPGAHGPGQVIRVQVTAGECGATPDGYRISPAREDDFAWLIARLRERNLVPTHAAFAWNFRSPAAGNGVGDEASANSRMATGLAAVFGLAKGLLHGFFDRPLRILYLVGESSGLADPMETAVSGLLRSLQIERPAYAVKLLQVDASTRAARGFGQLVWNELNGAAAEVEVRRAEGRRWVRRLAAAAPEQTAGAFRSRGVYVITGGLGELGFLVSCFLARHFQARLVLTGRSQLDDRRKERIAQIEACGGEILYAIADTGDRDALGSALRRGRERFGDLNGVLHLACVVEDGLMYRKTEDSFKRVLAPKIQGTLELDHATKTDRLDFFICFSSAVSVLGNAGQADYAAGCRFQDAFAESRSRLAEEGRRHGRTLTIAWSQWSRAGHTAPRAFLDSLGVTVLDTEAGLAALLSSLRRPEAFSLVVDGNPEKIRALLGIDRPSPEPAAPAGTGEPNLEELSDQQLDEELLRLSASGEAQAFIDQWLKGRVAAPPAAPVAARPDSPERGGDATADVIEECLGRRLKLRLRPEDRRRPFTDFGLDSINAVKVGSDLQAKLGIEVNPTLFWEHPTIEALARKLAAEPGRRMRS